MLFYNTASKSRSITQSRTVRFQSITTTSEESLNIARVATDDDTFNTGAFSSKAERPEPGSQEELAILATWQSMSFRSGITMSLLISYKEYQLI